MKCAGIIAEYNPFHNGHKYHIEETRRLTGCDWVAVCMSGSFVQRGEPAIYDKWTRASHALSGGADIVIELPAAYALRSAEGFAGAGVNLLNALGVDYLSFGSECGDIDLLKKAAYLLSSETPAFKEILGEKMREGKTYALARQEALAATCTELSNILSSPNNILAVEYLKALKGTKIIPVTVMRTDNGYNSQIPKGNFASATFLRKMLSNGEEIQAYSPVSEKFVPKTLSDFEELILYAVLTTDYQGFDSVPDTVIQRIRSADKSSLAALMDSAKSKNIPMSSVKRALLNIMIGNKLPYASRPSYINVLALSQNGAKMIKAVKKASRLPIITKPSSYREKDLSYEIEKLATDIYFLKDHKSGLHLKMPPVIK